MASPTPADDHVAIDPAKPLRDMIVCCTSIPPEHRTSLAQKVEELGGIHKYDLTPDVTHLIVGDYDTPKYRHVARERPDIKAMDAAWIDVLTELWKNDEDIDFWKLEKEHVLKPLEKRGVNLAAQTGDPAAREPLLICLTGFGDQREDIAEKITANGGRYTGDLTRKCTHLIVNKPEGKKFTAAKSWQIYAVTLDWLHQTLARGLILEEARFDPLLPSEEQGKGAWVRNDPRTTTSLKRSRSAVLSGADSGPRKLRKTASMKLNSQRNNIWGDILGRSTSREYSFAKEHDQPQEEANKAPEPPAAPVPQAEEEGVFSNCSFYVHGFNAQRTSVLEHTIATLHGSISLSLDELAVIPLPREPSYRFLIVPQTSQPDTHPAVQHDNIHVVTEYYIEKCLHNKHFFHPNEHVFGRPFPLFPIAEFSDLTICSAAFTGIELSQLARSVAQLGARFEEEFRKETSVLVCKSLSGTRKEKLKLAVKWGVPAVSADWLWECISTGFKVPIQDFIFPELKKLYPPKDVVAAASKESNKQESKPIHRTHSEPVPRPTTSSTSKPPPQAGVDTTAFDHDSPHKPKEQRDKRSSRQDSNISAEFVTARTHPADSFARGPETPLTEVSSARLNKSPSPEKRNTPRIRSKPSNPTRPCSKAASTPEPENNLGTSESTKSRDELLVLQQQQQQQQREAAAALQQAKAAERQALSSKLTSLIDPTTTSDSNSAPQAAVVARPRRRQILGRALSNASNASSAASADVVATKSAPESFRDPALEDDEGNMDANGAADDSAMPSTQLEYRDPEAQEYKAAVMSRMMGGSGEVKSLSTSAGTTTMGNVPVVGGRSLRRR